MTDLEKARRLLPCACYRPLYPGEEHHAFCPVRHHAAISAALKAEREREREACLALFIDERTGNWRHQVDIKDAIRARGEP